MTPGILNMLSTIIENMLMKLKLMRYKSIKSVVMEVSPRCYKIEAWKTLGSLSRDMTLSNIYKQVKKGRERARGRLDIYV